MSYKPNEIKNRAKKMKKDGVVYGYGYKYETVTKQNIEKKSKLYSYNSSQKTLMKKKVGKKAIDCSGFVNRAAGTNLGGSADIKRTSPQCWSIKDPSHVRTGMFVWRNGHVGLVYIEFGKKYIIEAQSTKTDIVISPWEKRASAFTHYGKIKGVVYADDKKSYAKYSQADFIYEMRKCLDLPASCSRETILHHTMTVSENKNRYASIITPLEKRLKALKLYSGAIEDDKGMSPVFSGKLTTAVKKYEKKYVYPNNPSKANGVVEAKGATWRKLLGL